MNATLAHDFTPDRDLRSENLRRVEEIRRFEGIYAPPSLHWVTPGLTTVFVAIAAIKVVVVDWSEDEAVVWIEGR